MIKSRSAVRLILAALVLIVQSANAAPVDGDRFSVSLGVFLADQDIDAVLNGSVANGTEVDFENDLGFDPSDTVFRLDGYYRFNDRHRIDFSVFDLSRESRTQIMEEIQFGDTTFVIDTVVGADLDLRIYKAAYTYSFLRRDSGHVGASLGLYTADVKVSLFEENLGSAERRDITAPLPVIGLRGTRHLGDKWALRASAEFFFIDYEGFEGELIDVYAGLDYGVLDNVAIGVGFNFVDLGLDVDRSDYRGSLDWQYDGALAFLKFSF